MFASCKILLLCDWSPASSSGMEWNGWLPGRYHLDPKERAKMGDRKGLGEELLTVT